MISSEISSVEFVGNDSASSFSIPYRVLDRSHLLVTIKPTPPGLGSPRVLVENTDYTVTNTAAYTGWSVNLIEPVVNYGDPKVLADGETLVIERVPPFTQGTDLRNAGKFDAEVVENAFDYAVMLAQRVKAIADTAVAAVAALATQTVQVVRIFGATSGKTDFTTDAVAGNTTANFPATGAVEQVAYRSWVTTAAVAVLQYLAPFTGAVVRTLEQVLGDFPVSVRWFGVTGGGSNESTALLHAFTAANGQTLRLNGLTISVGANTLLEDMSNVTVDGNGATIKLFDPTNGTDPFCLLMVNCSSINFKNVKFDAQVSTATGNSRRAVWIKTGSDITFEDCDFSKCREGVYAGNGAGVGPSRVHLLRCRMIAELSYSVAAADTNKTIPQFLADFVYGGFDSSVIDCYTSGVGIPVYSEEGVGLKVDGNTFVDGWDSQVYVKGERLHVMGNRIRNAGKDGIKVVATGSNNAYRAIIQGNHIEKFAMTRTDGSCGIHVQGRHHLVQGNQILLPTHAEAAGTSALSGIIIGARNVSVIGNTLIGTNNDAYQSSVRIWPSQESVSDVFIGGNMFSDTKFGIITQATASMDISNVIIQGNTAIRCWNLVYSSGNDTAASPKAVNFSILGNTLIGCIADGIYLVKHTTPTIHSNVFLTHTGGSPVTLDACSLVTMVNNNSDNASQAFLTEANTPTYKCRHLNFQGPFPIEPLLVRDGLTAPSANVTNCIQIYGDAADGDLKARYADGVVKVLSADT